MIPTSDRFDRLKEALAERYAVLRELGSGGMAMVYVADDLKHHRKVAVKVLGPELAAALGHDRFTREIEIAAACGWGSGPAGRRHSRPGAGARLVTGRAAVGVLLEPDRQV